MVRRRGFTLIEVLCVVTILMILAGIVAMQAVGVGEDARAATLAASVRQVREKIEYYGAISPNGYPASVDPLWFTNGRLPDHPWTGRSIVIEVVADAWVTITPDDPSYEDGGSNAWYNATNGAFCALVPTIGSADETAALFNYVNGFVSHDEDPGDGGGGDDDDDDDDNDGGGGGDDDDDEGGDDDDDD